MFIRTKITSHSKTQFNFFSKSNLIARHYWNQTDLPLLPRVVFARKQIQSALEKHEQNIPQEFAKRLSNHLEQTRNINWSYFNGTGVNQRETDKVKSLLTDLINIEHELPVVLQKELENVAVFESLKGALNCLEERVYTRYGK